MTARTRPPRRHVTIAAYVAVYAVLAVIACLGWGVVFLLWQVVRLAVAYPDLAFLSAAVLVVGFATRESWRQAREQEWFETESTRSEW